MSKPSGKIGLAVGDLTPEARQQFNVPDQVHGVVVQNVRPGSPADEAGIQPGDVILEIDRKPADSASQFARRIAPEQGRKRSADARLVERQCKLSNHSCGPGKSEQLERFRFICCHLKIVQGGFFLRKKPLGIVVAVCTRIENAVNAQLQGGRGFARPPCSYFCAAPAAKSSNDRT